MPNIHPLLTHFPIALLTMSLVFDATGLLIHKDQLQRIGWWLQLTGTIGLFATVISGLLAVHLVSIPYAAGSTFESHQEMAFVVSALSALLLLWRISCRTIIPTKMRVLFVGLMVLMVVLMWVGAWFGGELVYSFGVGVGVQVR